MPSHSRGFCLILVAGVHLLPEVFVHASFVSSRLIDETSGKQASIDDDPFADIWPVNKSRILEGSDGTDATNPGEACGIEPQVLKVRMTIFGEMGSPENREAKLVQAGKWLFAGLLRSMMHRREGQEPGSLGSKPPTIENQRVEPFKGDDRAQRSPFVRTHFDFTFPKVDQCSAIDFSTRVCADATSANEELMNGILRALDRADMYPREALQVASRQGVGLRSMIHISAALFQPSGELALGAGCDWGGKIKSNTAQGALLMPECPKNSATCEERPDLCTLDGEKDQPWKCKCFHGYQGDISVSGLQNLQGPFVIKGQCTPFAGYCSDSDGGNNMILQDGSKAQGVLGEVASPQCPDGYVASGASRCSEATVANGQWSPKRTCNWIPPREPPAAFCTPLESRNHVMTNCFRCRAVRPGEVDEDCECQVKCAPFHVLIGDVPDGRKTCKLDKYECPPSDQLKWIKEASPGSQCVDQQDQEPTHDFCCIEAFGPSKPVALTATACSSIKEDKVCLQSKQEGGSDVAAKLVDAPCCWRQKGYGSTGVLCAARSDSAYIQPDQQPSDCAVSPDIPVGKWEELPNCIGACDNTFEPTFLDITGCNGCVPGKTDSCTCEVRCKSGYVWKGGGKEGSRTCDPTTVSLGPPPACEPEPPKSACPAVEGDGLLVNGCNCQVNDDNCPCNVQCMNGFLAADASTLGAKKCTEVGIVMPVEVCDTISSRDECLASHASGPTGDFKFGIPCCWREETFANGKKCTAAYSDAISQDHLPNSCAAVSEAKWDTLPTCQPLCQISSASRSLQNIVIDPKCNECVAGTVCGCTAVCEAGHLHYGGGTEGQRQCSLENIFFEAFPVCRKPEDGEVGNPPQCPDLQLADVVVDGCINCEAGTAGCPCSVACIAGYVDVREIDTPISCRPTEVALTLKQCSTIDTEEACLISHQTLPCCWNPDGLATECGADGNCRAVDPVCAPKNDPAITREPKSCAKPIGAEWRDLPDCKPLCVQQFNQAQNVAISGSCDTCYAGGNCDCKVTCEAGFERFGGGSEGPRTCSAENIKMEEAPLCMPKEAAPVCDSPSTDKSIVVRGCSGCTAGENCECDVSCAPTYDTSTEDGTKGPKKCIVDPSFAPLPTTCEELTDEQACLASSDSSKVPCCWRGDGFTGGKKCATKGSNLIALSTPPDKCAATRKAMFEPFPTCQPLCINDFGSAQYVDFQNCDRCFVKQDDSCACEVKCQDGMVYNGGGPRGRRTCGHDEAALQSFGEAPVCQPLEPPKVPTCSSPANDGSLVVNGCKKCEAGSSLDSCPCDIKCASGYKVFGPNQEGSRSCIQETYPCPPRPELVEKRCRHSQTKKFIPTFCCAEAYEKKPEMSPVDCSAITDEQTCLKSSDSGTAAACCWRAGGFAIGKQCLDSNSLDITDEKNAEACSDRPPVMIASFKDLPVCKRKCANPYTGGGFLGFGGAQFLQSGCDDCVAGDESCPCDVQCPANSQFVGGGAVGKQICDATTGQFPKAPICKAVPSALTCSKPSTVGLTVKDCQNCVADGECSCTVTCANGFAIDSTDPNPGTPGPQACKSSPAPLADADCSTLTDASSCLRSRQTGGEPCCFRKDGLSQIGDKKVVCDVQGSKDMIAEPSQCAATTLATFPDLPKCLPKCINKLGSAKGMIKTDCDGCLAGKECKCEVKCAADHQFIGGGPEGKRSCTVDKLDLGPAPVCEKIIKDTKCPYLGDVLDDVPNIIVSPACDSCKVKDPNCRCTVTCMRGTVPAFRSAPEGPKTCSVIDAPQGLESCEDLWDREECISSLSGTTPCCWQDAQGLGILGGGTCLPLGSPKIYMKRGDRTCASRQIAKWQEMPTCIAVCQHIFESVPNLVYDKEQCAKCQPGKACNCKVTCAPGTERIGGGPEGARSCKTVDQPHFQAPPTCVAKPPPAACTAPSSVAYKAKGCDDCTTSAEKECSCRIHCNDKFQLMDGTDGRMRCTEVDATPKLTESKCKDVKTWEACLNSKEKVGGTWAPCCWRQAKFSPGWTCAAKGSADIHPLSPPDKCAAATLATFSPGTDKKFPVCKAVCDNNLREAQHVVVSGCNGCIVGEKCDCEVLCEGKSKPLPDGPAPGPKQCIQKQKGLVALEDPPICVEPCLPPDNAQGTLDVSKCQTDCAPGEDCNCEVRCAKGNSRVGGGPEGRKRCANTAGGLSAAYEDLPVCRPQCSPPDNQFNTLDVSKCGLLCDADSDCGCELKCFGKSNGGGPEGRKFCKFMPGNSETRATAQWVNLDRSTWNVDANWDQAPSCMSPMWVEVVNAQTQHAIDGVEIKLYKDKERKREVLKLTTSGGKKTKFFTSSATFTVYVEKEGYAPISRTMDRLKNCPDPLNCGLQFSLSEKLDSGDVHSDGCYVTGKPSEINWQMRAVLEWDSKPQDLDIWARSYDCYENVEKAYHCDGQKAKDYTESSSWWGTTRIPTCKRGQMREFETKDIESKACVSMKCRESASYQTAVDWNGRPVCPSTYANQFPKWVSWESRSLQKLQYRLNGQVGSRTGPVPAPNSEGWNVDNYILLDIDKRTGFGPETVTFRNVPPGLYQIAVNKFSDDGSANIAAGNPRVNLYMGGNSIAIECSIDKSCKMSARVWNVVNIEVAYWKDVQGSDEKMYTIRIIDEKELLKKLAWVQLPTSQESGPDNKGFEYFRTIQEEYSDEALQNVCYGKCQLSKDHRGFEDCMKRKEPLKANLTEVRWA